MSPSVCGGRFEARKALGHTILAQIALYIAHGRKHFAACQIDGIAPQRRVRARAPEIQTAGFCLTFLDLLQRCTSRLRLVPRVQPFKAEYHPGQSVKIPVIVILAKFRNLLAVPCPLGGFGVIRILLWTRTEGDLTI
jgi:hypothetical protein